MIIKLYKKISSFIEALKTVKNDNIKSSGKLSLESKEVRHNVKIESIERELDLMDKQKELKDKKGMIKAGQRMIYLGYIGTLTSLILSLCGGYRLYSGQFEVISFVVVMTVIQLIVFTTSLYESKLIGFYKLKFIQLVALSLSIYNSYNFFNDKSIANLILCIVLDFGTINLLKSGSQFKNLLYKDNNRITIIGMLFDNLTYKYKEKILELYEKNHGSKVQSNGSKKLKLVRRKFKGSKNLDLVQRKGLETLDNSESVQRFEAGSKVLELVQSNGSKVQEIKSYLVQRFEPGSKINVKEITDKFSLSKKEWYKIRNQIGELETVGTNTFFKGEVENVDSV